MPEDVVAEVVCVVIAHDLGEVDLVVDEKEGWVLRFVLLFLCILVLDSLR